MYSVSVLTGMVFQVGLKGHVSLKEVLKLQCMIYFISLFTYILFIYFSFYVSHSRLFLLLHPF